MRRRRESRGGGGGGGAPTPALTGRESLIRLIGKRRRILPSHQSLGFANRAAEGEGGAGSRVNGVVDCSGEDEAGVGNLDMVDCPVCGKKIDGRDDKVNSHLDACLAKGSNRKFMQSTLLQFRFDPTRKEKDKYLEDSSCVGVDFIQKCAGDSDTQSHGCVVAKGVSAEDDADCTMDLNSETCVPLFTGNADVADVNGNICKSMGTPSVLPNITTLDKDCSMDEKSMSTISTFIVGRRFADQVELKQGDSIFLLRDPGNVKDSNAIKVLSADSECAKVLGFLPRELSKHLSPLIEKYDLTFESSRSVILSVTNLNVRNVPYEWVRRKLSHRVFSIKHHSLCNCKFAMQSVLEVEDMQTYPPNSTKYQLNFQILVKEVLKNHCHVFTDEETLFIDCFGSLSDEGQRLFIRLYTRKGPWFRMSEVSYPEIVDCQQAIEALVAKGFLYSLDYKKDPCNADLKEVLDLLTVSELREIMKLKFSKLHKGISSKRRNELITSLLSSYTDGVCPTLPSLVFSRTGTCVRISQTADFLLWRVQRLFFLNGEQDLSAFLMVDLGRVKYPTYNCTILNHLFSSRGELLAYEEAIEVAQLMDQSLDANDTEMVMRCIGTSDGRLTCERPQSYHPNTIRTYRSFFSAPWVYSKVVTLGVSFLERERRYDDAIKLLKRLLGDISSDGRRGYWTLRLSIDLEHMGHLNESLSVAEEGLLDSWVRAGSRMALQRRVLRLAKPPRRWKIPSFSQSIKRKIKEVHIIGRPLNCDLGMRNRYYGEDGEQCSVEELVLQYYAGEGGGWHGVHTESGIWMTIFGLLMWEIMFADIPDVFHTKFQIAPLDLETDYFYIARKSLIESHLERIKGGMAEEILITSWESHFGTSCRGVNWDQFSLPDLRAAVTCVGGSCLASLCRLLAQDYRSWSSGMPDLLLWRFFGEYSGEAKLVEVKGPRDRLSEQQRAWLVLLEDCGFTTEVCKVSPEP
ncbi:hypothetical protein Sjap_009555 [Stephania japonica]|uniref:Fanconi-associated nuclease n=1 Tax=Stephania japonica TaxID=461633 RepID=A0AAP0JS67_9MAGN